MKGIYLTSETSRKGLEATAISKLSLRTSTAENRGSRVSTVVVPFFMSKLEAISYNRNIEQLVHRLCREDR